jgi:hypothetical protein
LPASASPFPVAGARQVQHLTVIEGGKN